MSSSSAGPQPPLLMHRRPSQAQTRLAALASSSAAARHSPSRSPMPGAAPLQLRVPLEPSLMQTAKPFFAPAHNSALAAGVRPVSLLQLHQQRLQAAEQAGREQAAALIAAAHAAAIAEQHCTCERAAALAAGRLAPPCRCTADSSAAVSPSSIAAASSGAAVASAAPGSLSSAEVSHSSPNAGAAASHTRDRSASAPDVMTQAASWAKSLSRLRSSLLSAYAVYRWALGGHSNSASTTQYIAATGAEFISPRASEAIAAGTATQGILRGAQQGLTPSASSTGLHALAHRATAGPLSSLSRHTFWHTLRQLIRALIFFARVNSRRFHRLLRPHLVLLMRSRALSRLGGMALPFLKRNLIMASHFAFLWGSMVILLKRYAPQAHIQWNDVAGSSTSVSVLAGQPLAVARESLVRLWTRWSSLPPLRKVLVLASSGGFLFLLYTCVQIVREYRKKRQMRRELQQARTAAAIEALNNATAAGGSFSAEQLHALLLDHHTFRSLDASPSPSPDPSPTHTPSLSAASSYSDLRALDEVHAFPSTSSASPPGHHSSPSFHKDCSACLASVIANTAVASAYPHTHGAVARRNGAGATNATAAAFGAFSPVIATPSSLSSLSSPMYSHPLAAAIAKRMEWAPDTGRSFASSSSSAASPSMPAAASALIHGGVAPGTPLHSAPASSLSFISPASRRLTHIKMSQMKAQDASAAAGIAAVGGGIADGGDRGAKRKASRRRSSQQQPQPAEAQRESEPGAREHQQAPAASPSSPPQARGAFVAARISALEHDQHAEDSDAESRANSQPASPSAASAAAAARAPGLLPAFRSFFSTRGS